MTIPHPPRSGRRRRPGRADDTERRPPLGGARRGKFVPVAIIVLLAFASMLGGVALLERGYGHARLSAAVAEARIALAEVRDPANDPGVDRARAALTTIIADPAVGSHRAEFEAVARLLDAPTTAESVQQTADGLVELDEHLANDTHTDHLTNVLLLGSMITVAAMVSIGVVERTRGMATELAGAADQQLADARLRALVEHAAEVVVVLGPGEEVLYHSPAVASVLGYEAEELDWHRLTDYLHRDDRADASRRWVAVASSPGAHARFEVRFRHALGGWVHLEVDLTNLVENEAIGGLVLNARDVTDRIELAEDLAHQAHHDPLTGLANRTWFSEQLRRALLGIGNDDGRGTAPGAKGAAGAASGPVSVVLVDLDGFKEINDSLGHGAGDEVLITVAARLATLTRHNDRVARLGGDEFAMVLVGDDPAPLAERLLAALAEPIALDVGEVTIGGSVGIATALDPDATVDQLLRDADVAMYDAKARGKNRASFFEPTMHEASVERLAMRAALDRAIAQEEFRLVYQPKMRLDDGTIEGFEALVRWQHPERGVLSPVDFIPVAEATGQIVPIGRWVLDQALGQLRVWQDELDHLRPGAPRLTMAVNVSVRQLIEPAFVDEVAVTVHRHGVEPETVTLELTETMLITDLEYVAETLEGLREVGVLIAVDDYGAGNTSIGYLRNLPVDILKIDRSFVSALDTDPAQADAYLRMITELAAALRLTTVAEGIEHLGQLDALRALGCEFGQGYHLAAPLDADAARAFLGVGDHGDARPQGSALRAPAHSSVQEPPRVSR